MTHNSQETEEVSSSAADKPSNSDRSNEEQLDGSPTVTGRRDIGDDGATEAVGAESTAAISDPEGEVILETSPVIRPVLAMLASVVLGGGVVLGVLVSNPGLVGDPALTEIVANALLILVLVIAGRLAFEALVLWRTRYTVRDDAFRREYELAYRHRSREIPVSKLRGHEYSQSRFQAMFDIGTVELLTAGSNRSLGFVEFEHLENPKRVREEVQKLSNQREHRLRNE